MSGQRGPWLPCKKKYDESVRDIKDRNYQTKTERNEDVQQIRDKMKRDRSVYEEKLARNNTDWQRKMEKWNSTKGENQEKYIENLKESHARRLERYKGELIDRSRKHDDFIRLSENEMKKQIVKNKERNRQRIEEKEHHFREHIKKRH